MYRIEEVRHVIERLRLAVNANCDVLGELDGRSGDGDLGLSMKAAFQAVSDAANAYAGDSISEMLANAAMQCNKAAPSTMGTLLSAGVMGIAKLAKGKDGLDDADVAAMPSAFAEAIMKRGKAKLGDKTILDALLPMANTVEAAFVEGGSLRLAYEKAADVAREAAENTAGMKAAVGRARWLGDRAAENPDAGAILCAILAESLVAP